MEQTLPTMRPNRTTKTSALGWCKLLAPPFERCPKCGESNSPQIGGLWRVADERGMHFECEVCAYSGPA